MNNQHYQEVFGNILISTNKLLLDINIIHQYLSTESYWALNIPKQTVVRAIENSICFGVFKNNKQVGFARVITDIATFAYLADVFIVKDYQGKGIGKLLMKTIHKHPDLQGLRRWMLATKDAHTLYEKFGWKHLDETASQRLMLITTPEIYTTKS